MGKVNGMGEMAGESARDSKENVGDVGDTPGVLRRTKLEIGVFADKSEDEPKTFTVSLLSTRLRSRGDAGG